MSRIACLILIVCGCVCVAMAAEPVPDRAAETARIEFLLKAMETSKLTFIRNGTEYSGAQAAEHLRMKWQAAKDRIGTARNFIALCATKSETSGTPYEVICADGKTRVGTAVWLETTLSAHELTLAQVKAGATTGPPAPLDMERVNALCAQLGDPGFEVREKATAELIRMGPGIAEHLAKVEKETKDPEVAQRCAKIREALEDLDQTALGVLRYIEQSDATFSRPGGRRTSLDGPTFSAHLQGKALLFSFSLTSTAKEFVEKIASTSSLHSSTYHVRLPDGTEMDVKAWLGKRFRLE